MQKDRNRSSCTVGLLWIAGGVISGIGKGVIASSFGTILKACGVRVTCIKIDPYLNIGKPISACCAQCCDRE